MVVIGKKAKHLTEANAMDCVFGYTIGNDVSERTWQKADRSLWRSKNADTFKPMGPWIETDVDLDKMETVIRVNGKETGRFHTNDMIFGVVPFLVELTKYFTLSPGDVIWMGTDGASPNLKAGDVVEIDITGIGTLRNRFVAREGLETALPGLTCWSACALQPLGGGLLRGLRLPGVLRDHLAPARFLARRDGAVERVPAALATMTRPSFVPSFLNASDWTAFAADLLRRSMISGGVLAGA